MCDVWSLAVVSGTFPSGGMRASLVSAMTAYLRDPAGSVRALLAAARDVAITAGPIAGPIVAVTSIAMLALRTRWRRRFQQSLDTGARVITVAVPPTVDPAGAVTFWSNLLGLLRPGWRRSWQGQPHMALEFVFTENGVQIQIWVPGPVPAGMIERAVEAAWPGAHTRTRPARPPIPTTIPAGRDVEAVGGELRLARSEALPLRTSHAADPIRPMLGAPVGLGPFDRACIQVLARPVAGRRVTRARRAAQRVTAGRAPRLSGRLFDLITPAVSRPAGASRRAGSPVGHDPQTRIAHLAQDRAVVEKLRTNPFETRVRYAIATLVHQPALPAERWAARQVLRGRGHAIASSFATYADHNRYRRRRLRRPLISLAERRLRRGDLLSVAELAAIAHLPTDEAVPGLRRAGAKAVPPPPGIPSAGDDVKLLGHSDVGSGRPVGLHVADARHHMHILGATGSGKSELMARMILADIAARRGVVVIDPKGDLVSDLLMRIPQDAGPRVVLFDADSSARPPVLNPLEGNDPARAVDNLVSIFSRIYAASWGPRTDDILRAGLLTLTAMPGTPTLADLPKLLTVAAFRTRACEQIHDEVLRGFWTWYETLSEPARAQVIAPLMNKVRAFLLRPFVRAAIAGGPSTVDMDAVLNHGGICLVRIARDALGMETSRLLGSIVVARTWQAATRRARVPQRERPDSSLYIDECHNFLNLAYPLQDILAESRSYALALFLAHQYMRQLPPELEEGISTNARSKIFFNSSPEDAHRLARHTKPRLDEHDLSNLDAYHVVARLVLRGAEAAPFTMTTEKLPPAIPGRAAAIRAAAQVNTRPRAAASHPGNSRPTTRPAPHRPARDPRRAA